MSITYQEEKKSVICDFCNENNALVRWNNENKTYEGWFLSKFETDSFTFDVLHADYPNKYANLCDTCIDKFLEDDIIFKTPDPETLHFSYFIFNFEEVKNFPSDILENRLRDINKLKAGIEQLLEKRQSRIRHDMKC